MDMKRLAWSWLVAAAVAGGALRAVAAPGAGAVRARTYGEARGAAEDGRVVTREFEEVPDPEPAWTAAGEVHFAFSVVPGQSVPAEDWAVAGFRFNLFAGRHREMGGLDIGLLGNEVDGALAGVEIAGIWNRTGRGAAAVQAAGIANLCERDFTGMQAAGAFNWTGRTLTGVQVAFVNRAEVLAGLQVGAYNRIDNGSGVQIGLLNMARELEGLQIGLFNVNENSSVPYLPLVNLAF